MQQVESRRIAFESLPEQAAFLRALCVAASLSPVQAAEICRAGKRTFQQWMYAERRMPMAAMELLILALSISHPRCVTSGDQKRWLRQEFADLVAEPRHSC